MVEKAKIIGKIAELKFREQELSKKTSERSAEADRARTENYRLLTAIRAKIQTLEWVCGNIDETTFL